MHRINLHAHSRWSDGSNTIAEMALQCQAMGFCACVITDHVYRKVKQSESYSLSPEKFEAACKEAQTASHRLNYPIFLGAEFAIGYGEEILVYGLEAIRYLLAQREERLEVDLTDLRNARGMFNCAAIIAHPQNPGLFAFPELVDGFEFFNNGAAQFNRRPVPKHFKGLSPWCNSDAHCDYDLARGWNEVEFDVRCEADLIDLIRKHSPTHMHVTKARTLGDLMMEASE